VTVYLNARFLTQPLSGVQRYAHELVSALDTMLANDPDLRAAIGAVVALYPAGWSGRPPAWQTIRSVPVSGGRGHFWEQTALLRASRDGILVSLGNSGPLSHPRQVVAFHDAHLFELPEAFSPGYRLWHRALRPRLARRARTLVTVSHHAAGQLAQHLSVPRSRFRILPNSAEHILRVAPDPAVLSRSGLRRGGYLLAVGNQSPNKNIARLVAAHATDPDLPPLAVAGGFAPGVAGAAIGGSDRVIPLGRVSDGELRALYEGARGFAFPSLHEGFGIPPLEAMALGTPVLCSARAALPEVLGEAPIWCDPLDTGDLAKGLALLARLDGDERAERIAAGFDRSAALTWGASAAGLIDLLLEDLEGRAGLSFPMGAEPAGLSAQ
jgi:glycosyltransferase involved in cell wall biosynthesis